MEASSDRRRARAAADAPPATPPVQASPGPSPSAGALGILHERFARGEIDEEEYTRRRTLIEGSG